MGENPHEDDYDNITPYDIWKDPMLWVAIGGGCGIVIGLAILIHVVRKRTYEWQLAEIEKFEAEQASHSLHRQDEEST